MVLTYNFVPTYPVVDRLGTNCNRYTYSLVNKFKMYLIETKLLKI